MQNLSLGRSKIFQTSKHLVISCSRSIAKLIFQKYDYFCLTASYICYRKFLYINNFVTPLTSYLLICFLLPYDRTRKTIKFELPSNMNTHIHHLKRERERERGGAVSRNPVLQSSISRNEWMQNMHSAGDWKWNPKRREHTEERKSRHGQNKNTSEKKIKNFKKKEKHIDERNSKVGDQKLKTFMGHRNLECMKKENWMM